MLEILGFLKSLPALIQFIVEFQKMLKANFGDTPEKFLLESAEKFKALREANTTEERVNAAKGISDLIGKL